MSPRTEPRTLPSCRLSLGLAILAATLLWLPSAQADRRDYVWNYQWQTMLQGRLELEWYFDYRMKDFEDSGAATHRHQLELEYGITDRWDVAAYAVIQDPDDGTDTDYEVGKIKLRTRYRFGEEGQYWMNPLLYLEYQRAVDGSGADIGEVKLILDRSFGRFDTVLNFVWEGRLDKGGDDEWKVLGGVGYQVSEAFHAGIEAGYTHEGAKDKLAVGPTLAWTLTDRIWVGVGVLFAVESDARDLEARSIVGFYF